MSKFIELKNADPAKLVEAAVRGVKVVIVRMIMAMARSVKPIVIVVRGHAVGLAFTK